MTARDLLRALAETYDGLALYPVTAPFPIVLFGADIAADLRWLTRATPEPLGAGVVLLGWRIGQAILAPGSPRIPLVMRAEVCRALYGTARRLVSPLDRGFDDQGYARWARGDHVACEELWRLHIAATIGMTERHERMATALPAGELADVEAAAAVRLRELAGHLRREVMAMDAGNVRQHARAC